MAIRSLPRLLRTLCYFALALMLYAAPVHAAAANCSKPWPAWDAFKKNFISKEGRVVDGSTEAMKTTSEGQSYAMFFALVANDRATFERLLDWTENNLAQGDLASRLPSWAWGKNDDGAWTVLDENSASDADLWLAYDLGEAGRLWTDRRYVALSSLIADRVLSDETKSVPGLGYVLLPGMNGFVRDANKVLLNPSYVPMQLMRWFSVHSKDTRWVSLLDSSRRLLLEASPKGYAPDWVGYDHERFVPDDGDKAGIGSYDAIRVYLWAGMLNPDDANYRALLDKFRPMARFLQERGYPPRSIQVATGDAGDAGSSGFSAAMLPLLQAEGYTDAVDKQLQRIAAQPLADNAYYDQVLGLFGLGWHDDWYRFDPQGNLTPRWTSPCQ